MQSDDPRKWPEVETGLLSAADAVKLDSLVPTGKDANEPESWLPFCELARELCLENEPLFGRIFLGLDPAPHIWRRWVESRHIRRKLWRISRGHSKTESITIPKMVHRVCYAFVPGTRFVRNSLYCGFENKPKAAEIMTVVQTLLETGGPGGLLNLAFPATIKGQNITIYDYVKQMGGDWTKTHINFPRIDGTTRKEPVLRAMTTGEKGISGAHPPELLFDDFVGRDGARTPHMRSVIRNYWSQVLNAIVSKSHVRVDYIHTLYHDEDQSRILERTRMWTLVVDKALNRYPTTADYRLVLGKDGVTRIKLTTQGETLKPLWPCPTGSEADCPATEEHYQQVGYHQPVKSLIANWLDDPIGFAQQYMHDPRATDLASVKPYMMRFYTRRKDDPRIGTVAPYHKEWDDFLEEAGRAGVPIPQEPPRIVAFPEEPPVFSGHAWDLAYGKKVESTDETALACRYRFRDGRVFHRFDAGRWRHGVMMKKVCINADSDPIRRPQVLGLPGGGTEAKVEEAVRDTMNRLIKSGVISGHNFAIKTIVRHHSKDDVFQNSGYAAELANGMGYFDIDDHDTTRQFLSVTPDESGGHDDRFDAAIYAKQIDPGGRGSGVFMAVTD